MRPPRHPGRLKKQGPSSSSSSSSDEDEASAAGAGAALLPRRGDTQDEDSDGRMESEAPRDASGFRPLRMMRGDASEGPARPMASEDLDDDDDDDDDARRPKKTAGQKTSTAPKDAAAAAAAADDDASPSSSTARKGGVLTCLSCSPAFAMQGLSDCVYGTVARFLPFQVGLHAPAAPLVLSGPAERSLAAARADRTTVGAADDVVSIEIIATGILSEDPDILHPMVRLHIVDATTGHYLEKLRVIAAETKRHESSAFLAKESSVGTSGATTTFETSSVLAADMLTSPTGGVDESAAAVDYLLPVATPPCQLRGKSVAPAWNDVIVVDVPFSRLLEPEVLLLFELVDFRYIQGEGSNGGSHGGAKKYAHGLYGIAWAYLRPVGPDGRVHVGHAANETAKTPRGPTKKTTDNRGANNNNNNKINHVVADPTEDREKDRSSTMSLRLQLYDFRPLSMFAERQARLWGLATPPPPAAPLVPAAYLQYLRKARRRYPSTLLVRVGPRPRPAATTVTRRPRLPTEREVHYRVSSTHESQDASSPSKRRSSTAAAAAMVPDGRALRARRRARFLTECCVLPDRLLCRVVPGRLGALTVRFSPGTGRLLAVACAEPLRHPIRLYDVASVAPPDISAATAAAQVLGVPVDTNRDGAVLLAELEGHHGLVYDLRWSPDERFLVSASADGTAKVWSMGALAASSAADFDQYLSSSSSSSSSGDLPQRGRQPELVATLQHDAATYVYCAAFATSTIAPPPPAASSSSSSLSSVPWVVPATITGTYDGAVRLWDAAAPAGVTSCRGLLGGTRAHEGQVNALELEARSGRVYTADSVGVVVVWKRTGDGRAARDYAVLRHLKHPDLANKPIVSLALHPRRRRGQLLVQAQASTLKLFDLTTGQPVAHYKGNPCRASVIRAIFSPDGRTVVAGADDGRAYAWNATTAERIPLPLHHVGYNAPLCDVSWHPTQHVLALTCYGGDHPVLVYAAPRPAHPVPIVAALDPNRPTKPGFSSLANAADDKEKAAKRKRRLMELQARRKVILEEKDRQRQREYESFNIV